MEKVFNAVNQDDGISGFVILANSGKYHAILHDDDSNNNVGIFIYPELDDAISKCKEFVNAQ